MHVVAVMTMETNGSELPSRLRYKVRPAESSTPRKKRTPLPRNERAARTQIVHDNVETRYAWLKSASVESPCSTG
jgi:hypothetical protein